MQDIQALRSNGIDLKSIEEAISKTAGISKQKLNSLLNDVVERNQKYYTEVIDLAHVTQPETLVDAATVDAIKRQTHDTFRNLTASMGFLVGNTMLKPARVISGLWITQKCRFRAARSATIRPSRRQ